jgi:hypothetical protein
MARIRSIKPEFWDSPDTLAATLRGRLLYIAMWNWADDFGIGDANLNRLVSFAFPGDAIAASDLPTLASEMSECFGVVFYEHLGRPYYWIPTWEKHQRTEKKAQQRIPFPDEAKPASDQRRERSAGSVGESAATLGSSRAGTGEQGKKEEGTGEQGNRGTARDRAETTTALVVLDPEPSFDDFWAAYPRKDDKPAARKAWARVIKTTRPTEILAGAIRYATDPNRTPQFTKTPGPWLNAEAWNNGPLPARTDGGKESSLGRRDRQVEQMFTDLQSVPPLRAIGGHE